MNGQDGTNYKPPTLSSSETKFSHYYGDYLRRLFFVGAIASIVVLPFYPNLVPSLNVLFVIAMSLVVVIFAGITNPISRNIVLVEIIISSLFFVIFQYYTVSGYQFDSFLLSFIRQVLALIFIVSLYYGVKTYRGMLMK